MLYTIAEELLLDISSISQEARAFLEEERYRNYLPVENVNPSTVVIETIPILIDELGDYGILVRTDPATIAESGPVVLGFFKCMKYLLPNGIQPLIRNDMMLLTLYEELAGRYSTSESNIVTDLLMAIGAGHDPYVKDMRDACLDVLDSVEIIGTGQYADIILNMCNIVRSAKAADSASHLDYVTQVFKFHEGFKAFVESSTTDKKILDVFSIRLTQLVSILTSSDVMDNYADVMFSSGNAYDLNLTVPVLALSPLVPSYWSYHKLPIGGVNTTDAFLCQQLVTFVTKGSTDG